MAQELGSCTHVGCLDNQGSLHQPVPLVCGSNPLGAVSDLRPFPALLPEGEAFPFPFTTLP